MNTINQLNGAFSEGIIRRSVLCCFAIFYLSLSSFSGFSQNKKIDSLKALLPTVSGNEKGNVLLALGNSFYGIDYDESIKNYDEAVLHLTDSVVIVRVSINKAITLLLGTKEFEEVERVVFGILPYAERQDLQESLSRLYSVLGGLYNFQGKYGYAVKYLHKSVILAEIVSDGSRIGDCFSNLAVLYYKIRDNNKALIYLKKALAYAEYMGLKSITVYVNTGLCYSELDSASTALWYFKKASEKCDPCPLEHLVHIDFGFGMAYLKLNALDEAKRYFKQSLSNTRLTTDHRMKAENYVYLSRVFLKNNEYDSAKQVLDSAEHVVKNYEFNEIELDCYRQRIELYKATNDYSGLASYQDKFIQQKEKIYGMELSRDMAVAEGEILEKEHLETIRLQNQQIHHQSTILQYQEWAGWCGGVIAIMLTVFIGLQYRYIRDKKMVKTILEAKVAERMLTLNEKLNNIVRFKRETVLAQKVCTKRSADLLEEASKLVCGINSPLLKDRGAIVLNELYDEFSKLPQEESDEEKNINLNP